MEKKNTSDKNSEKNEHIMRRFRSSFRVAWMWVRRRRMRTKILLAGLVIALVVVFFRLGSGGDESNYVTEDVRRTDVVQVVSEIGSVSSGGATSIYSPTNGVVDLVYVENGDFVSEGDTLFTVVSSATEQEQAAANAIYLAAVAKLDAAQSTANTLRADMYSKWHTFYNLATSSQYETDDNAPKQDERLAAEFQIAQDQWLAAESKYKDQQTAIAQARTEVSSTYLQYQATVDATVKATAVGTVSNLSATSGEAVQTLNNGGTPVLLLAPEQDTLYVEAEISEIDISKIQVGQEAAVEIDAIDDTVFEGEVERVDSVGTSTDGVVTYSTYIRLFDSDADIRSGMTANVDVVTAKAEQVVAVPNSAVKPYQGGRAVQILENGSPVYVPVRVGVKGETDTQILDGIGEGETIIVGARNEAVPREGGFSF